MDPRFTSSRSAAPLLAAKAAVDAECEVLIVGGSLVGLSAAVGDASTPGAAVSPAATSR